MQSRRLKLNVVGISDVDNFVLDRDGIDLDNYEKILRAGLLANTEHMRDEIVKMNIFNSVRRLYCQPSDSNTLPDFPRSTIYPWWQLTRLQLQATTIAT